MSRVAPRNSASANVTKVFRYESGRKIELPLYGCHLSAGFPSPADDHIEKTLDLNTHLIENPAATFFARACGNSMEPGGIFDGDLLIVDRSIKPKDGRVVVVALNGEMVVKRLRTIVDKTFLFADNTIYSPIEITEFCCFHFWGVVTASIHRMRSRQW
jgi:DNA polymerase V